MRYGIRTEFQGIGQAQYDSMHALFAPLASAAPGFVAHIAGPMDGGWYTIEVWDSKHNYEQFVQQQVVPRMPADAQRPKQHEFEVYSRQTKDQPDA